ncbi:MAG: hypothetical protein M5U09_08490 [Gammaproteobacteria bacterium]|nr:hypothetical protein [Gammaproteobacteria bacterium]
MTSERTSLESRVESLLGQVSTLEGERRQLSESVESLETGLDGVDQ